MAKRNKAQQIERDRGKPIADVLSDEFARHGSQSAVAKALGVSQSTISYWLLKTGLVTYSVLRRPGDNGGVA